MKETAARSAATSHWFVTGPASNATPAARLAAAADASQGSPGPSLPAGTAVMRQKLGVRLHGRTPFFRARASELRRSPTAHRSLGCVFHAAYRDPIAAASPRTSRAQFHSRSEERRVG